MGTYTNSDAMQLSKSAAAKTGVLDSIGELETALVECVANACLMELEPERIQSTVLEQFRRSLQEMRSGVALMRDVVEQDWPE